MKVLIAGGTGFIGKNLVKKLSTLEVETVVLARNSSELGLKKTSNKFVKEFHYTRIEEIELLLKKQSVDYILNLATNYDSREDSNYVLKAFNSNILFTTAIIELSLNHKIPLISFGTYLQEIQEFSTNSSFYVLSKTISHDLLFMLASKSDFRFVELILNDTYGEEDIRQKFLYNVLNSMKGIRVSATYGEQLINLLHVDDVCDAIIYTLNQLETRKLEFNHSYGIRSSKYVTLRQLASICESVFQKESAIDWGTLNYRGNEVFSEPNLSPVLPNWLEKVPLEIGLQKLSSKFKLLKIV
ncbi:WcaG Nucleoside-diphosphate-sugar epimerases [Candidatus Nanopelagicaceae bacterium]